MDYRSQVSVRGPGRPARHASVAWRAAHQHLGSERARFQPILAIYRQEFQRSRVRFSRNCDCDPDLGKCDEARRASVSRLSRYPFCGSILSEWPTSSVKTLVSHPFMWCGKDAQAREGRPSPLGWGWGGGGRGVGAVGPRGGRVGPRARSADPPHPTPPGARIQYP